MLGGYNIFFCKDLKDLFIPKVFLALGMLFGLVDVFMFLSELF